MKKSILALCLISTLGLTACGDDGKNGRDGTNGTNGLDGTNGTNGTDGTNGTNGLNSLVNYTKLTFGNEKCWLGGTQVNTGLDKNNNNQLEESEITNTSYDCKATNLFSTVGVRPNFSLMTHIKQTLDDVKKDRYIEFRQGGFGSDMVAHPTIANRYYAITDRGPNADYKTTEAPTGKQFPDPGYVPRIGEFEVTEDGRVVKIREILLKDRNGQTITGLPNPAGLGYTNEGAYYMDGTPILVDESKPYDATTNPFKTDAYGLDAEGLVALADGTFWVSDEYGPHIIHYDATGKELDRINAFEKDDRRKSNILLPAEFQKRRPNRGMEGLTITPDGKTLVGIMQSSMSNPNGAANKGNITRIVTINLETKAIAQYLYRQGVESENISGKEYSHSGIVALSDTTFLVIERDGEFYRDNQNAFKRVYKIDLRTATNLESITETDSIKQNATAGLTIDGQTLEQVIVAGGDEKAFKAGWDKLAALGIKPVEKSLTLDMIAKVKYPHDKMEGLWVINNSTLGVMNDDDFALWVNPQTFALQQKYLDKDNTVFDGNTLYVIDGLDLNPIK